MHKLRMPETHFDFCRMNVHVHFFGGQIEKKQDRGKDRRREHIAVRLVNRMQDQPVTHQAPVHEDVNSVAVAALHVGT